VVHGGAFVIDEVPVVLELGRLQTADDSSGNKSGTSDKAAVAQMADFSKLSGRITQRERIKLVPGATATLDFDLPMLSEGLWVGRVTVEYDDDLGFDNRRYFSISAAPPYRVLVVKGDDTENALLSETYFLETALRLATPGEAYSDNPFAPDVLENTEGGSLPELSDYASIVLANVAKLSPESAARIARFVQAGGGLLVFSGDQISEKNCVSLRDAGLTVGQIGQTQITRDLPWRLDQWNEKHLIFQEFSDPQHGDLRQLIFAAYTKIVPASDASVLASFRTGDPAVIERPLGKGTILWFTTSCGRDWSNWSTTRLFLPIVHQLIGYQVGLSAGGHVRGRLVDAERKENAQAQDGNRPTTAAATTFPSSPGVVLNERYAEVVNISPRESETEASTHKDFEDRFGIHFVDSNDSALTKLSEKEVEFRPDEIWHWVACLVLCGVLLEGFIGNRTTA
jgi:hypothetical protein